MAFIDASTVGPGGLSDVVLSAASAGGDTASVNRRSYLLIKNGGGASVDVTLASQADAENGTPISDTTIATSAGGVSVIPLGLAMYRNENQQVEITYSATDDLEVAVLEV